MDAIQSRYGWTDQQVLALPAFRFFHIKRLVERAQVEEQRNKLREQSYGAWQINNLIRQVVGEKPVSFIEHIEVLGLLTKEDRIHIEQLKKVQHEQQKKEAEKAQKNVERILDLDKERFNRNKKKPAKPTK